HLGRPRIHVAHQADEGLYIFTGQTPHVGLLRHEYCCAQSLSGSRRRANGTPVSREKLRASRRTAGLRRKSTAIPRTSIASPFRAAAARPVLPAFRALRAASRPRPLCTTAGA